MSTVPIASRCYSDYGRITRFFHPLTQVRLKQFAIQIEFIRIMKLALGLQDVGFNRTLAVEYAGEHRDALLGEDVGQISPPTPTFF